MPMPTPRGRESQENFTSRFMGDSAMVSEYPDEEQRHAVAMSTWHRSKRKNNEVYHESKSVLTSNLRNAEFEGRPVIVAPVTILVEGVHHGSDGPLYYPSSVLQNYARFWNGVSLPVYHPEENGQSISVNSPEVTEARSIGRLWNVRYSSTPTPRLHGEAWIEVAKANAIAPEVLARLENNQPIEVSTGLFSTDQQGAGVWNNEPYQATVMEMRPDHLAILPNAVGACSVSDGCGLRANEKEGGTVENNDTEEVLNIHQEKVAALIENEMSLDDRRSKVTRAIYSMDGPTQDNMVEEVYDNFVVYTCRPGPQSTTGTPAKMYKRNYSIDANGVVNLGEDIQEVRKETNYVTVNTETKTEKEVLNMADVSKERKEKVTALISNGAFTEDDRPFLENCECAQFTRIETLANKPAEKVVENAKPQTFEELLAAAPRELQEQFVYLKNQRQEYRDKMVAKIKDNASNKITDEQLAGMDITVLESIASSLPAPTVNYEGGHGIIPRFIPQGGEIKQNTLGLPGDPEPKAA